jgi:hypothetical protein
MFTYPVEDVLDDAVLTWTWTSASVNRFDVLEIAVEPRIELVARLVIVQVIAWFEVPYLSFRSPGMTHPLMLT